MMKVHAPYNRLRTNKSLLRVYHSEAAEMKEEDLGVLSEGAGRVELQMNYSSGKERCDYLWYDH